MDQMMILHKRRILGADEMATEIIGIEPVEQKEVFIGWMLTKSKNS